MKYVDLLLNLPDYQKILNQMQIQEKDRIYCKHQQEHALDVARIGYIISLEKGQDIPKEDIYLTALLHDLGRTVSYLEPEKSHAEESVKIAQTLLEKITYPTANRAKILQAIAFHGSKNKDFATPLAVVIAQADQYSRNCWACPARSSCYWDEQRKNTTIIY